MLDISLSMALLLFSTGVLAGVCNAVAGGGTFFTFPVLLAAGLPPIVANASNAVAVWPGHALAVVGYRQELSRLHGALAVSMAIALAGGVVGAMVLARTGNAAFSRLIPFLILFATLLFAGGRHVNGWLLARRPVAGSFHSGIAARCFEFVLAVYGGFFGAGLGVMLMGGLVLLGVTDLQANNALKNLLATVITTVAVVIFSFSGLVSWPHTLLVFAGAMAGGVLGARLARALSAVWLRRLVISLGMALSVYYFDRYYRQ